MFSKAGHRSQGERPDEALTACDDLIHRFEDDTAPKIREVVARAMLGKTITLRLSKGPDEAITAHDDLIDRFKDDDAPEIQEVIATATKLLDFLTSTPESE
jgi:hypothetical protein